MHSAMVESGNAMAELESWRNMELLKDDAGELMKMYDCLVEALDGTKGEQKQAGSDNNIAKYSFAPDGKLANNGIERDMPDAERAEVLRNTKVQVVPMVELSPEAQALVEHLGKGGMGRDGIKKAIMSLPEYKAINGVDLHSESITVPFRFSNSSLDETLKKMEVNGRFDFSQAQRFVELLGNLSEQVKKATAIEVHTDRYLHRVYNTTKIENYGAMLGIAQNGNAEIPVLYELKNFKGNEKDKLYLVATFEETKKGPMQGRENADSSANAAPTNTGTYIVSDYLRNINSSAGRLLKYFPNELMSDAQIQNAEIARLEQEKYVLGEKIGVGNIDLKDGKPVQQSQIDEIDRQIAEIKDGTAEKPNVKFSLREPVEETRDLLAVHNLTEENMRSALELGGFAMPSIAVIKAEQGHSKYGPISVIFNKATIDPKTASTNEIYGGDAWTPTFPQVEYEVAEEAEKRIRDKYYEISEKYGNEVARPLYSYAHTLEEAMNNSGGVERIIEKTKRDTSIMQAYLADSGQKMVEPVVKTTVKRMPASQVAMYDRMIQKLGEETMRSFETPKGESPINYRRTWMEKNGEAVKQAYIETLVEEVGLDESIASEAAKDTKAMKRTLLDAYRYMKNGPETREEVTDYEATDDAIRAAVDSKAYEAWLNGLFAGAVKGKGIRNGKDIFTSSGNRRSFAATHWDVTLDNVVRAMRSEEKTGVGSIGGRNIEGAAVKQYSSIKEMKADSDRLQTIDQDEYEAMRKGFRDRFSELARAYAGDGDWFDAGDVLVEAVTKHQTADNIYKYISKYADLYKPSKRVADDLHALVEEMKNVPTGYFEAKPRRAIGFDEMAALIVPDNLSDDVYTALEDAGVNMIEYEAGNEADRLKKMNGDSVSQMKFSLKEAAEKYDGKDLANDKSLYDYDFMTALPDMRVTEMADINAVRDGGNVSEELVINLALANGRENGHVNGDLLLVQNAYTGRNIRLTTSAIRHGLGGRKHAAQNANARAFAKAGELMKNAVPINALYNTAKAADGTYAMAAFMRDASNKSVQVAVLTVEQRNGDVVGLETYDTLHAMNTRKWNVGDHKTQSKNSSTRSSAISIDDFLEIVNETHQSLLSEDVLAHFDAERNAQGYYSGRAKFSLKETDETVQEGLTTLESLFHLTSAHRMTDKEAARMARKAVS